MYHQSHILILSIMHRQRKSDWLTLIHNNISYINLVIGNSSALIVGDIYNATVWGLTDMQTSLRKLWWYALLQLVFRGWRQQQQLASEAIQYPLDKSATIHLMCTPYFFSPISRYYIQRTSILSSVHIC